MELCISFFQIPIILFIIYHTYYYGSKVDTSRNIFKSSSANILVFTFPLDFNSIAEFNAEIEYSSKSIVAENDPYNFTLNYQSKSFNPLVNFNLFKIIIPDNCYFKSITNSKFIINASEHELVFKGLEISENAKITPLRIHFSKIQTRLFILIIWINRVLIFIVIIYLLIQIYNIKYLQLKITYNLIGKFILSGFLLELVKHFDESNFWDGFLYTETYLYIISLLLWYYSNHIILFFKKLLESSLGEK